MSATQQPEQRHIKVDNTTLTKEEQDDFLRRLLPACQPQEGSPANTFTRSELDDLQRAVGNIKIEGKSTNDSSTSFANSNKVDIRDVEQAFNPPPTKTRCEESAAAAVSCPQEGDGEDNANCVDDSSLDQAISRPDCVQDSVQRDWHASCLSVLDYRFTTILQRC